MFSLLKALQDSVAAVAPERHYHWMAWLIGLLIVAGLVVYFVRRFSQRNKPSSSSGSASGSGSAGSPRDQKQF